MGVGGVTLGTVSKALTATGCDAVCVDDSTWEEGVDGKVNEEEIELVNCIEIFFLPLNDG